jgi:hypothetical protein
MPPRRATVNEIFQLGVESVEGTGIAALKRLLGMRIAISPHYEFGNAIMPQGSKYMSAQPLKQKWSTFAIDNGASTPDYNGINYPLSGFLTAATITTPGGATNARQWQYSPRSFGNDSPVSYTMQQGNDYAAEQIVGAKFNSLEYAWARDGDVTLGGDGFGQAYTTGLALSTNEQQTVTITGGPAGGTFTLTFGGQTTAGIAYNAIASAVQTALEALSSIGTGNVTVAGGPGPGTPWVVTFTGAFAQTNVAQMTTSSAGLTGGTSPASAVTTTVPGVAPTDVPVVPILSQQIDVYLDTTAAGLGTTKLLAVYEGDCKMGDRFAQLWTTNSSLTSYAATVEQPPSAAIDLTMEWDAVGQSQLAHAEAGDLVFIRVEAKGANIDAGVSASAYRFTHDIAAVINAIGDKADRNGVQVVPYTFAFAHDPVSARAHQVQVVTPLTAL